MAAAADFRLEGWIRRHIRKCLGLRAEGDTQPPRNVAPMAHWRPERSAEQPAPTSAWVPNALKVCGHHDLTPVHSMARTGKTARSVLAEDAQAQSRTGPTLRTR